MSQVTGPLTINDGAATPVARSFAPTGVSPERTVFTERSAASSQGFWKLEVSYSPAGGNRSTNRVDLSLDMPVTEVVAGVNQVTRVGRFKGYYVIPDTMTQAERSNLRALSANMLDNAQIVSVIKDLDPLY